MARIAYVGCLLASLLCAVPAQAQAQSVAEFYKGRTVSLIIPNAPGGSFDLYARLVADNIGRFIPGHPAIVPQNMPGAGGMQAANYLTSIAAKDGSVMSVLVPNITLAQVLGVQAVAYDTRKLNWIGRIIATTSTLFTWHTSATKTLADLKTRETLIASTGAVTQAEINSTLLNGVVGTKLKLIRGYKGSAEAALAVERGEADGTLMPWELLKAAHADWIQDGKITIVARFVRRPIRPAPTCPRSMSSRRRKSREVCWACSSAPTRWAIRSRCRPACRASGSRRCARPSTRWWRSCVPGGCRQTQARPAARPRRGARAIGGGGVRG